MNNSHSTEQQDIDAVTIRPLRPSDFPSYAQLHSFVFQTTESQECVIKRSQWVCDKNPAGACVAYCAICDSKCIGVYAAMPLVFLVCKKQYIIYQVNASAVHPDYRGRYIFQRVARSLFDKVASQNKSAVFFGFPNNAALKISTRCFDYKNISYIRCYKKPLNFYACFYKKDRVLSKKLFLLLLAPLMNIVCGAGHRFKGKKALEIELKRVYTPPSDYDSFWENSKKDYDVFVARDRAAITWRFFEQPIVKNEFFEARLKGKLVGYVVLKPKRKTLCVVDFFCIRKEKITRSIFYALLEIAKRRNAWWVEFRVHDEYIEKLMSDENFIVDDTTAFFMKRIGQIEPCFEKGTSNALSWYLTGYTFDIG